jgi:N-acetylmuramoyl-L-alanine amidase
MPSPFLPDSSLVHEVRPSPNFGARRGVKRPDMLILHYTGMKDCVAALRRLCEKSAEVSAHYLVFEDGRIVQMVPEKMRAWHAGVSFWKGKTDINSHSIGIEICNPGHEHGYRAFPKQQMKAVIALCRDIVKRNKIHSDRVLAHSDIAPGRKEDPGEKFPWQELHKHGVGLSIKPVPISKGKRFRVGDHSEEIRAVQKMLKKFGYYVTASGKFDETTRKTLIAFQRHFRPKRIDGVLDASTRITLRKILAISPARAV